MAVPDPEGRLGRGVAGAVCGTLKVGRLKVGTGVELGDPAAYAPATGKPTTRAPAAEAIAARRLGVEIMRYRSFRVCGCSLLGDDVVEGRCC
jgi:hypothetical protein